MNTRHGILMVGVALLVLCAFVGTVSATTIIWVPSPGNETIQQAVNNASRYDTITVRDGIYTENIDVTVDHLTIRSENGSALTIVQAVDPEDNVFDVKENYVNISGFTATGAYCGIGLYANDWEPVIYCNISNNVVRNNGDGIHLYSTYMYSTGYNTITNNNAYNNSNGIYVRCSSYNTITNNNAYNNSCGISLPDFSHYNTLTNNTAYNNLNLTPATFSISI